MAPILYRCRTGDDCFSVQISWRDSYRTMKPSKEDAEPAKISHDGTPTIFSFLTQPPERGEDDKAGGAADALHAPFESFTINSQQRQESDRADGKHQTGCRVVKAVLTSCIRLPQIVEGVRNRGGMTVRWKQTTCLSWTCNRSGDYCVKCEILRPTFGFQGDFFFFFFKSA